MDNTKNNKRIAKNTLMLYFRMILTMAVSLYTSRIVLNTLGVEDFGIYNVVGGVVTMFGFLNGAMSSSTQRFLSFYMGKGDDLQLRKTFSAALIIHIGIAVLIAFLAETVGIWLISNHLNLPGERIGAIYYVFHFSVLTFAVSIVQIPYHAILIARERMDIYAYVSIVEVVLKLILVFLLATIAYDKLELYATMLFIVSLIIAIFYQIYTRNNFRETHFQWIKDRKLFSTLLSYSGWNLFGGVAAISKAQGVSILLNIFFGTVVNAAHGIANQVSGAVNVLVTNFQLASNPQIIKSYATGDKIYLNSLVIRTAKFSLYLLFILILPLVLEVDYILKLWLKNVPSYTAVFTVLVLVNVLIDSVSGPLMTSMQATGRVKIYQAVVGILLILILPVSYILFSFGNSPYVIFVVSIGISTIALIFRLLLVKKHIEEFSVWQFVKEVIINNIPVILISVILPALIIYFLESGFLRLLTVSFTSAVMSGFAIYFLGLNSGEKLFVKAVATKLFAKLSR